MNVSGLAGVEATSNGYRLAYGEYEVISPFGELQGPGMRGAEYVEIWCKGSNRSAASTYQVDVYPAKDGAETKPDTVPALSITIDLVNYTTFRKTVYADISDLGSGFMFKAKRVGGTTETCDLLVEFRRGRTVHFLG